MRTTLTQGFVINNTVVTNQTDLLAAAEVVWQGTIPSFSMAHQNMYSSVRNESIKAWHSGEAC